AKADSCAVESGPRSIGSGLPRVSVKGGDRQRRALRKRIPERDSNEIEVCSGTKYRLYLLHHWRGARLDWQPDGHPPVYGPTLPRRVPGGATEKPIRPCVWLLRRLYPVLSLHY